MGFGGCPGAALVETLRDFAGSKATLVAGVDRPRFGNPGACAWIHGAANADFSRWILHWRLRNHRTGVGTGADESHLFPGFSICVLHAGGWHVVEFAHAAAAHRCDENRDFGLRRPAWS